MKSPQVSHYAVFHDDNRHTCIRVDVRGSQTLYIPFSVQELRIVSASTEKFEREFKLMDSYDPKRAAERYRFSGDGCKVPITPEAMAHLERLAGPAYVRPQLEVDPAPNLSSSTVKKEDIMSKKTDAAPVKKAAPVKAAPAAAPAKTTKAAAKAAPAPAKKAAKTAAPAETGGRGRQPNVSGSAKIKVLSAENPKRGTAAERFALYKNGMTVDEYIAAGGKRADVNWDVSKGFIEVK